MCTAPTFRQVRKVVFAELRKAHKRSRFPLGGVLYETELRMGEKWGAFGISTEDPDAFQGIHAPSVLVVLDEAPGVTPGLWTGIDAVLSGAHCRLLAIGNPTENNGPFFEEFRSPTSTKITVSAFDTPNFTTFGVTPADIENGAWEQKVQGVTLPYPSLVTPEWVADKYRKWGKDSPLYRSRVLGEFPHTSADTLISLADIAKAQTRELHAAEPNILAVDIARYGDDKTVMVHRQGPVARIVSVTTKASTMETAGRIVAMLEQTRAAAVRIDSIGVGSGVYDRLNEMGMPVFEAVAGNSAEDPERYANARAEWYWHLRDLFVRGEIDIDPEDEELVAELSSIKYKFDSKGRILMEKKDDMRKRGFNSPDIADAYAIAFAPLDSGISFLERMTKW